MLAKRVADAQAGVKGYVRKQVEKQEDIVFDYTSHLSRLFTLMGIVIVSIVASIIFHGLIQAESYKVVDAQQQVVQLNKENDVLKVQVTALKSPTRIQKIAQENLGMVLPSDFVYSTKAATEDRDAHAVR